MDSKQNTNFYNANQHNYGANYQPQYTYDVSRYQTSSVVKNPNSYDPNFNNASKHQTSSTAKNHNSYDPNFNNTSRYQTSSAAKSPNSYDPNFGLETYKSKNNSNVVQMQIIQQMTRPITEDTDAGKTARNFYQNYSAMSNEAKNAYYKHEMTTFESSKQYNFSHLEKELTAKGYNNEHSFQALYNNNKDNYEFKQALPGYNGGKVKFTNSYEDMLKTGEVKYKVNNGTEQSANIDRMAVKTNFANAGQKSEVEVTGRKWLQSFADANKERELKLVHNGKLVNEYLRTDVDLRRFNLHRMSSDQLKREIELFKTDPNRSIFRGYEEQFKATGKVQILEEAVQMKAGLELAEKARNLKVRGTRKRQAMRALNKASNGEDALAGYQQIVMGKDLIKMAIKAPVSANKAYHSLNQKALLRQQNSKISYIRNKAQREYEHLYGDKGRITKRNERVKRIKEKTDVKGRIKKKVKEKVKDTKLNRSKRYQARNSKYAVRKPKKLGGVFKKVTSAFRRIKELLEDPLIAMRNILMKFVWTKFLAPILGAIGSAFMFIVNLLFSIIKKILAFIVIIVIIAVLFVVIFAAPLIILGVIAGAVSSLINSFKGDNMTLQEIAKDNIYEQLEGHYNDDEIDEIMTILSEKSGLNIGFVSEDEENYENNRYGLGGLTSEEYAEMASWIEKQGGTLDPIDGELDGDGNVNKGYIDRITQLQTQYLRESGKLDEWMNNH